VSERNQEVGCWILSNDPIGELTGNQVFWHLDSFATREAAEAAKGRRSTVLQALGKVWLLTIDDADSRASSGQHVSTIGPLPITPGTYTAQYMEAVFTPLLFRFWFHHVVVMMMVVMVMDDHLLLGWHRVLLFHRKGRNGEAERNEGRQGNSKLLHGIPPGSRPTTDDL